MKYVFPLIAALSAAAGAHAQGNVTDAEYAKAQAELQKAINDAAGSTRPAIVLPVSALENAAVAQSFTPIVKDPESNVAIEGYDPVGYFTENKAMLGDPAFRAEYEGAVFFFAKAEHRDAFLENPKKFIPAYGGYCTETIAAGALTPASPLNWTLHGDRLYLTRSPAANEAFRGRRAESIEAADQHWKQADLFRMNNNFKATNRDG